MDSENDDSADGARETLVAEGSAGSSLRAAREALRLDLAHIAAETRIPLRHLEAIEDGNFESLPSRAYAIGFSRTFAKAVGLDPAAITDAIRDELADGAMRRTAPSAAMEPGDPARLPSAGLAWAAAVAALVLMVGAFSFYNAYFGAGTEPGSLLSPAPDAGRGPVAAQPAPPAPPAPAPTGAVVLTALEEGVWLRLSEQGGARLLERTLKLGEAVTVPATAADPRINTGRPDALAITIGGQAVAKLAERPVTQSGVPVSATALLARVTAAATAAPGAQVSATNTATQPQRRPVRRAPSARPVSSAAPSGETAPQTDPAAQPAPPPANDDRGADASPG